MTQSLVYCLAVLCVCSLGGAVDVKVLSTKPVGTSGDTFKLKGRCTLLMTDRVEAREGQLTIQFDKDTKKFKSGKLVVLTSNSTTYHVTNKKVIKTSKFALVFTLQYTGHDVPSGTCSDLQVVTTSTSTSTSTATPTSVQTTTAVQPPEPSPYFQKMRLISSWTVPEGIRFQGMFRFDVQSDAEPMTESFNVSFGQTVTSFMYWRWEQTTPDPAITSGTRFSMTNRYLLDCSTEVYFFQATVASNQIPDVTCHSTLKASSPPTTQQPTQPPKTTQNPETTQAPATTQQPPTTMEPAPFSQKMGLISSWTVPEGIRFEGMFRFEVQSNAEPFTESFNIRFGMAVTSFKYWRWEQTTPDPAITSGTRFLMTNRYLLDCSTEVYFFQATVAGNQIPDVTCHSTLKASNPPTTEQPTQPPQTTQNPDTTQAPATTQQPPTTMEPAPFSQKMRLISSWTVPEGTRFEGMFRFEVQSNAEPFTESFNVVFGMAVTSFKYWRWEQTTPDPAITSGTRFSMTNRYLLDCSTEVYFFQATVAGNQIPDVTCHSTLKASNPPTTQQPTQSPQTTHYPETTQTPATTQQPPTTMEPAPFSQKMRLISSWTVGEGTRFEGMFRFEVQSNAEPFTESFNVVFGVAVTSFKYWRWEQTTPDPAITSGTRFSMTNRYLLDCSTEVYFFQATVAGNHIPDVTCHSTLKFSNPPTTQQPTQPPQTTQNPETTHVPATTQQPPTTMEPAPFSQKMRLISSRTVPEGTRFEGMFRFEVQSNAEPFTESFNVVFGMAVTAFKYWRWEQTTPDPAITSGTRFSMTNRYLLDCSTEVYFFQATVAGNQIPDVTCHSTLKASNPPTTQQPTQPPQTTHNPETTQAPATTQQPPTTMEPAPFSQKMRLISSWTVPEGTRFEGMFRFEVQSNAEPFTESFNVVFGMAVTSFKYWRWEQTTPDPAITSGTRFLMTNRYLLDCSTEVYFFQATVTGNQIPDVTCHSTLKASSPPTTQQPTQPPQTTQNPETTQAPATTHQPPTTMEPAPFSQKMRLISSWTVPEGTRFEGMFRFKVPSNAEPFTESFNVVFEMVVTSFKYWRWEQTTPDPAITSGTRFSMTNRYLLDCSTEVYFFQATVAGNQIPDVTCHSTLKASNPPTTQQPTQPPQTTQNPETTQAPATTQQPPTTMEPAPFSQKMRLISSWTVPEGTRFEGMFRFEVQSNAEPFTESFNVVFGMAVTSFKYWRWEQTTPDPAITSGSMFLMTNRYLLDCSTEVYFFQATVAGNQIPDVTCHSTLKAYNPETTQQPTRMPQTTTQRPPVTGEPDNCQNVEVQALDNWLIAGDVRRMKGQCVFPLSTDVSVNGLTVDITWDKPTHDLEDYNMTRIDADDVNGLWKYSTNTYPLSENTFKYEFEVSYIGSTSPHGRCFSELGW